MLLSVSMRTSAIAGARSARHAWYSSCSAAICATLLLQLEVLYQYHPVVYLGNGWGALGVARLVRLVQRRNLCHIIVTTEGNLPIPSRSLPRRLLGIRSAWRAWYCFAAPRPAPLCHNYIIQTIHLLEP